MRLRGEQGLGIGIVWVQYREPGIYGSKIIIAALKRYQL